MVWRVFSLALLLMASTCLGGDNTGLWLGADYRSGKVDGYVQIPAGGEPDTSTRHRPTLAELGIDEAQYTTLGGGYRWGAPELYIGWLSMEMEGSNHLDEDLVTRGVTIPAGNLVAAEIELSVLDIGYRHHFRFGDLDIAPSAGFSIFIFDYTVKAEDGIDTSRAFSKGGPMIGLSAEWRPNQGPIALTANLSTTLPCADGIPVIAREELIASYRVSEDKLSLSVFFGIGAQQINYDDGRKQELPNEIDFDFGPQFLFGLRAQF